MGSHMCAQPSATLYRSVIDLMMTTWLVETCCLFDTFMVIKEYCCADVLSFVYFYVTCIRKTVAILNTYKLKSWHVWLNDGWNSAFQWKSTGKEVIRSDLKMRYVKFSVIALSLNFPRAFFRSGFQYFIEKEALSFARSSCSRVPWDSDFDVQHFESFILWICPPSLL